MTDKPVILDDRSIRRFVLWCIAISSVAAIAFLVGRNSADCRQGFGAIGFGSAIVGMGVSAWFALRSGGRWGLVWVAICAAIPMSFWVWMTYENVHGRFNYR
jgi:hypothetical protein